MKKRVLHVLNTNSYSGAENVAISIIEKLGNEFELAYSSPEGPIRQYLEKSNIKFIPLTKLDAANLDMVVQQFQPDIVHAHDFRASLYAARCKKNYKLVSHLHHNPPWLSKKGINSFVYAWASTKCDQVLTVSEAIKNEYVFSHLIKNKVQILGNPIYPNDIREKSQKSQDQSAYDIVFLGRLDYPKDPKRFIDIIDKIKHKHPDVKTCMIGDGKLSKECEEKIKNLRLQENIKLKGFMENPYGILKNSKILIMTSRWEGFGLAAVEALSLGVPVLASPVGGLNGFIKNDYGKLCISDREFENEALALLEHPEKLKTKSRNAIAYINERYNSSEYEDSIANIYNTLP